MRALSVQVLLLILAIAISGSSAFAQEAEEPDERDPEARRVTEEITVTARKQEESIQDVPLSVAAPDEETLRDRGAETLEDVAVNVAGFSVQNAGPGQSQVGMRGVSAGRIIRDQPGVKEQVGMYLDESVISLSLFTPDIDLFDLARVEVLRGPQGTLFGSGSLSGTVRYITNQPRIGISETIAELGVSSITGGGVGGSAKVAANVPVGATSALRVVAYFTEYGGFMDAVQPDLRVNEDVNDGNRYGARLAFLFQPSDRLSITPRILYQEVETDGWNRIDAFNILANPFTTTRPQVTLGGRRQFTQFEEPFTDEFLLGDLNIEYDLGAATLTSITSFTNRDILVTRDATALTASITGGTIALPEEVYTIDAPLFDATEAESMTQEVRLSGERDRLQWVAGAFYSDSTRDYRQNLPVIGFTALSGIPTAGTKLALTDELYKSDLHYDFTQLAAFAEATYAVSDRFDVTGGLRWYDFEEDRNQIFDGIFSDPIDSTGSVQADGIAPRVILSYELSEATRLNAQVSKGFRLGGINDPLNVPLCVGNDQQIYGGRPTWRDESLWNYEIGSKSSLRGGRGLLNVAAYHMDITDLQASVTAGSCSSRIVINVPQARATGVEAEFEFAPTDSFDFAISGNVNDSELGSSFIVNGVTQAGIEEGNRLPSVPEFQMAAAATYRWKMARGMAGYAAGVYQHVGDRYTQVSDQQAGFGSFRLDSFRGDIGGPYTQDVFTFDPKLPAYDLINLRVGILRGGWDTALFVNNVTDERALLAIDLERGSAARVSFLTNQPRTFGISTRVNF
ncbi:MAG TPA: TonB-dependent receptor [Thermoanaerobaculia bacterium]|nr:TonB-dependent receptor [Thermoanaerobaculia bacterium]